MKMRIWGSEYRILLGLAHTWLRAPCPRVNQLSGGGKGLAWTLPLLFFPIETLAWTTVAACVGPTSAITAAAGQHRGRAAIEMTSLPWRNTSNGLRRITSTADTRWNVPFLARLPAELRMPSDVDMYTSPSLTSSFHNWHKPSWMKISWWTERMKVRRTD